MWTQTTLGEICDQTGGEIKTGPFGSQLHKEDYSEQGTPVVMPSDITDQGVSTESVARVSEEHVERLSQHQLAVGDIVYARRGDIGRCALVTNREKKWLCGTGCLRVSPGNGIVDPEFLYYYLRQPQLIEWIENQAVGATMPNLNTEILRSVPIEYPPLPCQKRIAEILAAFDDLIENNRRRIEILEEMARTIYREWFVNFNYPGHENDRMKESELGEVPEGWEAKTVGEVVDRMSRPKKYKQKEVEDNGAIPVVDQSSDYLMGYHNNPADYEPSPGDPIIIFGDHTCKQMMMIEPFSIGANVIPFVAEGDLPVTFVFHLTKGLIHTQEYKRHWTDFKKRSVTVPPVQLAVRFAELVMPMHQQIRQMRKTNKNLRETRDLLLPRLISGEIEV
jgi:type I restriction enzyme S subunit